jgi:hypothetical protein
MDTTDRASANEVRFVGQSGTAWCYRADQPLGTPGGFGGVYAAEGPDLTPMAVKVVKKQRPSGTLDDRLLRREIDIGRRVRERGSDRLLPVIDAADDGDALLLVMARAGEPLSAVLPMSEPGVIAALADITAGLQDLHSIGIIHRDLKPPNVLRHDGHWKLADFGIARDQEIGTQDPTFTGWGSMPYMAPELWELKSPTVKTDLYALGCLAFELLSGAPPYSGGQAALRKAHLTQAPPDAPCSNITLKNLIGRLIAKDLADRPQDARAVLDRLHRAVLTRNPAQEAIARGLGAHQAERSRDAAEATAAKAAADARLQQIVQARTDLREIFRDTLEDIQAVEADAALEEQGFILPEQAAGTGRISNVADILRANRPTAKSVLPRPERLPGFTLTLSTPSVRLQIKVWEDEPMQPVAGDTMLLAGVAVITNRRQPKELNAANVVYEQDNDHFSWRVYRFRASGMVTPDNYRYGPYGRSHGLRKSDFFHPHERHYMLHPVMHVWTKTVIPLTTDTLLELFQEAVDLPAPDPRALPY